MTTNSSSTTDGTSEIRIDLTTIYAKWSQPFYQMHKVSPQLRMVTQQTEPSVYDPMLVSLGPYHHGKPELRKAEEFKYLCLDWCLGGRESRKELLYNMIFNMIDKIRSCYAEVSIVDKYDDKALALMMLLDACYILNYMEYFHRNKSDLERVNCIGVGLTLTLTARDLMVLENQIPFFVLRLVIDELYGIDEGKEFLLKFLGFFGYTGMEKVIIPGEDKDPPVHFLDACRRVMIEKPTPNPGAQQDHSNSCLRSFCGLTMMSRKKKYRRHKLTIHSTCGSVTDLKAKGVRFCPSSSYSFKDIKFHSHAFYGNLQLPICNVSHKTRVHLPNMMAYEISPRGPAPVVVSYVILMKSLIQTAADANILQEMGIFRANRFSNLEEVVQLFQSINTFGLSHQISTYVDVVQRVGEHCNNKANTWMAELFQGKLKNPWTVIAMLVATLLVVLTLLQTYYTMHPVK